MDNTLPSVVACFLAYIVLALVLVIVLVLVLVFVPVVACSGLSPVVPSPTICMVVIRITGSI